MFFKKLCPGGGMVDTMVLEAIVERRGSSSLPWGTKVNGGLAQLGERLLCKQ